MSLISEHSQAQMAYEPTLWAKLFHSAPHVNITFHHVEPRFNPENDLYLESLGILASVPAAWLITTLVVLLIYLCTRCCDTKSTKHRKSRPIRCILSFFALVTAAGLAGGFWGNHVVHGGMTEFEKATENIGSIIRRIQEMSRVYNDVLQKDIEQNMNKLYDGPFQRDIRQSPTSHLEIMDNSDFIFFNITEGLKAMDEIRFTVNDPNNKIDLRFLPFWAALIERYRWPVTMALQVTDNWSNLDVFPIFVFAGHFHLVLSLALCGSHCTLSMCPHSIQCLRTFLHNLPVALGVGLHHGLGGLGGFLLQPHSLGHAHHARPDQQRYFFLLSAMHCWPRKSLRAAFDGINSILASFSSNNINSCFRPRKEPFQTLINACEESPVLRANIILNPNWSPWIFWSRKRKRPFG